MRCGYGRATLTFDSDNDAAPARINKRLTLLIGMMRPIAVPNEEAECTSLCKCEKEILRLEWQCSSGTEEGSALLGPAESLLGTLSSMSREHLLTYNTIHWLCAKTTHSGVFAVIPTFRGVMGF